MSAETDQRLADIADGLQAAVTALQQGIADAAEIMGKDDGDEKIAEVLARIASGMEAGEQQEKALSQSIIDAVGQGIEAMRNLKVQVRVAAPQVTVAAPTVEVRPQIHVPAQPAPQVNIDTASEWRHDVSYDRVGRITGIVSKRVS